MAALILSALVAASAPVLAISADMERWPKLNDIEAKAWIVMDRETGEVIMSYQSDLPVYPASTTKIMTAVLALESEKLVEQVTISENAVNLPYGSSKVGFLAGENVLLQDVLYGLMLASGNDAANILAEALAGSQEDFADQMNAKAKSLGMTGSHFINPSGLHDPEHVVTAFDMARLAVYAMKNVQFRTIVSTRSYSLPATNLHPFSGWAVFYNSNRLVIFGDTHFKSDLISSYEGIKTGTTKDAGNTLVAAATSITGQKLISVIMGVPLDSKQGNMYMYSRTLLEEAARLGGASTSTTASSATTGASETSLQTSESSQSTSTGPTEGTTKPAISPSDAASVTDETMAWRSASIILLLAWLATLLVFAYQNRKLRKKHPGNK